MNPWTHEQREFEAQERFERRERELEDESLAGAINYHGPHDCPFIDCVNAPGCDDGDLNCPRRKAEGRE